MHNLAGQKAYRKVLLHVRTLLNLLQSHLQNVLCINAVWISRKTLMTGEYVCSHGWTRNIISPYGSMVPFDRRILLRKTYTIFNFLARHDGEYIGNMQTC